MTSSRLIAVVASLGLSGAQYRYFPCNKMPILSFLGGVGTLLLLYGVGERLYGIAMEPPSPRGKFADGGVILLGGGFVVAGAGFFTLLTHLCP